jgi:hypothetical protein
VSQHQPGAQPQIAERADPQDRVWQARNAQPGASSLPARAPPRTPRRHTRRTLKASL